MSESRKSPIPEEFLPSNEAGRIAVERARRIVKDNNQMINALKAQSNLETDDSNENPESLHFSFEGPYTFQTTKIKSSNGIKDFILDIFGAH